MVKKNSLKVRITTTPVSWTGGKPLKYQSMAAVAGLHIYGDPKPTPEKALAALAAKANRTLVAAQSTLAKLDGMVAKEP